MPGRQLPGMSSLYFSWKELRPTLQGLAQLCPLLEDALCSSSYNVGSHICSEATFTAPEFVAYDVCSHSRVPEEFPTPIYSSAQLRAC